MPEDENPSIQVPGHIHVDKEADYEGILFGSIPEGGYPAGVSAAGGRAAASLLSATLTRGTCVRAFPEHSWCFIAA